MKIDVISIIKIIFKTVIALTVLFGISFAVVLAQTYVPLSPLPGTETVDTSDPSSFFSTLFILFVSVAAILAVIKLMLCGFQYMTSEAISSKENAKKMHMGSTVWNFSYSLVVPYSIYN